MAFKTEMYKKAAGVTFMWMDDEGRFHILKGNSLDEIIQQAEEEREKKPLGMLCPVTIMDENGTSIRRVAMCVHDNPDENVWDRNLTSWIRAVKADKDAIRLLSESKPSYSQI